MRPKKSVNELEESLRESTPPATAVPSHFRQQLRCDLQAQATAVTPPILARRWLLAPALLLSLVILAFWFSLPKTAVEPAIEINVTRPVPMPTSPSPPFNRDEAIQAAFIFARRTDNKPIGGWLVEPNLRAITITTSLEAYQVAMNRLGSFAIADFEGSNIIFPENETETVWFVQLIGRWQPFGETADMIEPIRYVAVLVDPDTGQIVGAGSSTVPFVREPLVLSLADYPPQERPYLVEQGSGFWPVHAGSQLLAFDRRSPYRPDLPPIEGLPSRCLYAWVEAYGRFTDPCSGDEWELDGTLYLPASTELWSDRNLDQYRLELDSGSILVHLDEIIFGERVVLETAPTSLDNTTFSEETVLEATPTPLVGTSDQPQTDFETVIGQVTVLVEQRQTFLSSHNGWFYTAVQEYQPLYDTGEPASFLAAFATEKMLSETWYHASGDGSADQVIYRTTNSDGLVVALSIFMDGYEVNFFGDTISQMPQQSLVIPNEAAWVVELLGEMQGYNINEPSVTAYMEQVDGHSHYIIQTTNIYHIPIPAASNSWGQTLVGEAIHYVLDADNGQLLSQENISIGDSGEQVSFSRTFEAENWLTILPDDIAFYHAQAQARLANSNLTWIAPTPTPDFNPALAQVSDTQYDITVSVLDVEDVQGEIAVRMTAQVGPSWGVVNAFPFFQTFLSWALLYGEGVRPIDITHVSGEMMEVDETTGGWREGSTHYFEGELVDGAALRLETAVNLTNIPRIITLPITLEGAAVGQSWALDWPVSIGAGQLLVSEVAWVADTADGQAQLQLHLMDNSPTEIDIYCLSIGLTDPWQEECSLLAEDTAYTVTVPPGEAIVLHLRLNVLVNGFELHWQP